MHHAIPGAVTRHADFPSRYVAARPIDVWAPPGYTNDPTLHLPVIYMHDGQNLFETGHAYGGVDWGVREAMLGLIERGRTPGAIIVGVWNTSIRWREYMPQQALDAVENRELRQQFIQQLGGEPVTDHYLRFLVQEVKPFIDAHYRTLPDRANTLVMGSSMGGLASLYAISQYPQVYGAAGCLSTHWTAGGEPLVRFMGAHLPPPDGRRLYFDFGTQGLDEHYEPFQRVMDGLLQAAGYRQGVDWVTRKFEGADHNEAAWRERVHIPLDFLLPR
jgi:predicted alpha/beta superfamily hydrolase